MSQNRFHSSHVTLSSMQSYWENGMELHHHHFYTDELQMITSDRKSLIHICSIPFYNVDSCNSKDECCIK